MFLSPCYVNIFHLNGGTIKLSHYNILKQIMFAFEDATSRNMDMSFRDKSVLLDKQLG